MAQYFSDTAKEIKLGPSNSVFIVYLVKYVEPLAGGQMTLLILVLRGVSGKNDLGSLHFSSTADSGFPWWFYDSIRRWFHYWQRFLNGNSSACDSVLIAYLTISSHVPILRWLLCRDNGCLRFVKLCVVFTETSLPSCTYFVASVTTLLLICSGRLRTRCSIGHLFHSLCAR